MKTRASVAILLRDRRAMPINSFDGSLNNARVTFIAHLLDYYAMKRKSSSLL